jgi:hypothetical protein
MEYLWNDTIQIPESVDVGKAIVAFIENFLCGIPLVFMFIRYKWQLLSLSGSVANLICIGTKLRLDLDDPNFA